VDLSSSQKLTCFVFSVSISQILVRNPDFTLFDGKLIMNRTHLVIHHERGAHEAGFRLFLPGHIFSINGTDVIETEVGIGRIVHKL
jgi:hypothetical protein